MFDFRWIKLFLFGIPPLEAQNDYVFWKFGRDLGPLATPIPVLTYLDAAEITRGFKVELHKKQRKLGTVDTFQTVWRLLLLYSN